MEVDQSVERMIEIKLIQDDAEVIMSLMKSERDPIFSLAILPYYSLFVQSCQEYLGNIFLEEDYANQVKNIRNYIKAFDIGLAKSKRRVDDVDSEQDNKFSTMLRFGFMKSWNIHCNLGIYWTKDKHAVGNTQMYADFLGVENMNNDATKEKMQNLGYNMGSFVASIKAGFEQAVSPAIVDRALIGTTINYYCDLNTNRKNNFFIANDKDLSLYCLNLVCNMNFVRYILTPLFAGTNAWIFRIEYVVTYYTYKALCRLKNYCENNDDLVIDMDALSGAIHLDDDIFQSKFRNCMMHYGLQKQGVLSLDNIEKPLFGMIETCFDGMDFCIYQLKLREFETRMIKYLESYFNTEEITIQKL